MVTVLFFVPREMQIQGAFLYFLPAKSAPYDSASRRAFSASTVVCDMWSFEPSRSTLLASSRKRAGLTKESSGGFPRQQGE